MFTAFENWLEILLNNPVWLTVALLIGLALLLLAADWLVDGASGLAKRLHVSDLMIGLTVVAFGTSVPELVVNLISVADGVTDLAVTNVLGSNIINVFVILGFTALVFPVAAPKSTREFDIPVSMIAGILILVFACATLGGRVEQCINHWEGALLLLCFVGFLIWNFAHRKDNAQNADENETFKPMQIWKACLLIVGGLLGLSIGGELTVKSAVHIATQLGVSDAIIGLTIVAIGTSLPELATSVIAACKKNTDLALGNVIGSNIFNIFLVLGVSATICPLPAYKGIEVDAIMAALGGALVWILVETNKEKQVKRWGGAILLLAYAGYLAYRLSAM